MCMDDSRRGAERSAFDERRHSLAQRANPTDKCDWLATALGDFWVTFLGETVQNRAKWGGTDGINP